jgi:Uma2 family endonuclease
MTSLLVQSDPIALSIDLSSLTTLGTMSDQQFYDFCRTNPELQIERNANGTVIVMAPAAADTGNRNIKIATQIENWSEANGQGLAFDSSAGFTLTNGATRSPDAAWILSTQWDALSAEEQASFAPIVPDFVVELRSSSDTLISLQTKMDEYRDNGVRLGLLIDRKNRQVYVYRTGQEIEVLSQPDVVNCEPEMLGFELKMGKVW